jgi:predicted O-methyltransferase YrrM
MTTRLATLFPPVGRLHASLVSMQHSVARLATQQDVLAREVTRLAAEGAAMPEPGRSVHQPVQQPDHHPDPQVPLMVPPGHYYSPIVKPDAALRDSVAEQRRSDRLEGVTMDLDAMQELFGRLVDALGTPDLPQRQTPGCRYYIDNEMYGVGDALILAAMLRHLRPRRWIEVGSGFSSAVLLDTLDRTPGLETRLTFIEPYTDRLDALLREADRERVTVLRAGIQAVPLETFDSLGDGDVLFLDTTHVAKTGSDVNHEFFRILPRLASGVIVHLHDVFADFEYPDPWIFAENRSWNEQYLLRAFLMYNSRFEVLYANDFFARHRVPAIRAGCPAILANPGGGFWMRKR